MGFLVDRADELLEDDRSLLLRIESALPLFLRLLDDRLLLIDSAYVGDVGEVALLTSNPARS